MLSHYSECHYDECCVLLIVILNVIVLSVVMLSVIALSVVVLSIVELSVVVLSVIVLNVVVLSVIMLSVVVPFWDLHCIQKCWNNKVVHLEDFSTLKSLNVRDKYKFHSIAPILFFFLSLSPVYTCLYLSLLHLSFSTFSSLSNICFSP